MTDRVSKVERSKIMSKIKSKDTKLEVYFREILSKNGLRFKTYPTNIEGKPDIIFTNKKLLVFVDSCFWHGCPKHCRIPKTNNEYWTAKIIKNTKRDRIITNKLKKDGWAVLRLWEHDIKNNPNKKIQKIVRIYYK